jgi:hypothetical protein
MGKGTLFLFLVLTAFAGQVRAEDESERETVEFHIPRGTGTKSWNTQSTTLVVKKGQTLLIVNDDTIEHRLHTNGAPCPHGEEMKPGASDTCDIDLKFDPELQGPLYDHLHPEAKFWLKAIDPTEAPESEDR